VSIFLTMPRVLGVTRELAAGNISADQARTVLHLEAKEAYRFELAQHMKILVERKAEAWDHPMEEKMVERDAELWYSYLERLVIS
jgi:hypothetical protein